MRKIHVVLIGQIRPNIEYNVSLIKKIKNDIPQIITHISYWKTNMDDKKILLDNFDFVYENDEPSLEHCVKKLNRVPRQTVIEGMDFNALINIYKTFVNMWYFFEKSAQNIADRDILFRFRTDIVYQIINLNEFNKFIKSLENFSGDIPYYMVSRSDVWKGCCDWHGISQYTNIKMVWGFSNIVDNPKDYNLLIGSVYNAETIIAAKIKKNNIKVYYINNFLRLCLCGGYDGDKIFKYRYGNIVKKKIRFIKSSGTHVEPQENITEYYQQPQNQFIEMFLPNNVDIPYVVVDEKEPADICFYSVQLEEENLLRTNELNVFFSIENFQHWGPRRGHYKHYNKFGPLGSKKANIFISNNHSTIEDTEHYKIIPAILCRIQYYEQVKEYWKKKCQVPFSQKRFILFTSRNPANENKRRLFQALQTLGDVHFIDEHRELKAVSCYHSEELIKVYSQYKFIVSFENSHSNGYITEKIFNAFMAQTIPIYDGAPDVCEFLNKKRIIILDKDILNKLMYLKTNETMYNHFIEQEAVNEKYRETKVSY